LFHFLLRKNLLIAKSTTALSIFFLLAFTNCNEPAFVGSKVYLCNRIEGDSIDIFRKYVFKKYVRLFSDSLVKRIKISNPGYIDSIIIDQHNNYNNCDTFGIINLYDKCRYVILLKFHTKIKYKTGEPVELNNIPFFVNHSVGFHNITITDENPEYHYHTFISGNVYDLINKKRVYVFSGDEESEDDSDTCTTCIKENIDNIFDDFSDDIRNTDTWAKYQKLNHLNLK
jgi:hypothetical protein